jgi:hypothetical protein
MRKSGLAVLVVFLLGCSLLLADDGNGEKILQFDTMVGVTGGFVGTNTVRDGVPGAGAAWQLEAAHGQLKVGGELKITVKGLVLVRTGANPSPTFRGIVSCLTTDGTNVTIVNVPTGTFPATPTGDSKIEETLTLPSPCVAPIIFVAPGAGALRWFAATGF